MFFKRNTPDDEEVTYTEALCKSLADKMADNNVPTECKQFPKILADLKRRNSDRHNHAIAFEGMSAGEAAAAMAAREKGQLYHAQIQRRLTSGSRFKKQY
jgi:hypothetical protein